MPLISAAQFPGLAPDPSRLGTGFAQGQQMAALSQQSNIQANEARLNTAIQTAAQLSATPSLEGKMAFLRSNPSEDNDELLEFFTAGQTGKANEAVDAMVKVGQVMGVLKAPGAGLTAKQQEFGSLTEGMSAEDIERAKRIDLGLSPRAVGSATQTILEKGIAEDIGGTEATISKGKESGKLLAELKYKPAIESAVISAKKIATQKGDVFNELSQATAALPGLSKAVDDLRELSKIATSTLGGKIFDAAVKQTGFGSTKGATAKAKFIAIVNNQVLPLLKPTFGAAFTVAEGESLKATMGDPEATTEEKMAQLDAFIEQKLRDIETKQAQLSQTAAVPGDDLTPAEQAELQQLRQQFGGQ
jgi:hypothetical protein